MERKYEIVIYDQNEDKHIAKICESYLKRSKLIESKMIHINDHMQFIKLHLHIKPSLVDILIKLLQLKNFIYFEDNLEQKDYITLVAIGIYLKFDELFKFAIKKINHSESFELTKKQKKWIADKKLASILKP